MTPRHSSKIARDLGLVLAVFLLIAVTPGTGADSPQDIQRQTRVERVIGSAPAPPVSRNCDADFPAEQYNDRIDCKTENVNVSLFEYIDTVIDYDKLRKAMGRDPVFTDAQMDQMLAGRDRAQAAKNRSHQAKAFRGTAKKQKGEDEDCYTSEIIGDNRGDDVQPCEAGEECEEVIGDGIGNDDGKCKLKGNNREVCVQVCQQPLLTDADTYDPNQAFDTEQGLEELDAALIDANEKTRWAMDKMQTAYNHWQAEGSTDECGAYQFDLFPASWVLQVSQVAKNASGAAFNGCSVVCNQDAFGWNCEAACLVFAIIDGILNGVHDAFDLIDGANGSAQLDQVARCTTQLDTEIGGISAAVDGNAAALDAVEDQLEDVTTRLTALTVQIDALTAMMMQRFNTVDGYLCVPQGQRECFPDGAINMTPAEPGLSSVRPPEQSEPRRR
jgi:hypothetical protein